ncbi:S4 domain-containing protein YaaA [Oceanobacillus sp. 143]|jgi:ribosome-associated protein|uniref:S4 domain-containing protein YaaA n=2 Tax=Oceanobacillus TaxID=182709 RepID=A0A345PBW3_9BACI|nr:MULTISPECIES: S4 domain-containing protein YaaA [Oceanobacillus]AXI07493.1 S4 domain-containing protein YaaA [Oceanobacillus zhaokaii]QGS67738.1 S4 domain-containing protein YaaA [Oceanobacillus sp. 143]RDW16800.1 S4 domain-containing protein YaaA [Oceanobacillus chungangensis]
MQEEVKINTDYITLGQFVKLLNILESGGMVKSYLQDVGVIVNGELEHRRGRKLYTNDVVEIEDVGSYVVKKED